MASNYPGFISALEKTDPKLFESVSRIFDLAMSPGELDARTKILISLAIDAFANSAEGVKHLAGVARSMGVTEGQIAETLRIAYQISGNKTLAAIQAAYEK
ncbi:MAG: carboxymuconolactone decarboxylase family protein [Clostridiales bacterium]|jgi:alkylhydroperoxidase/carboxymuconolactone decarboxylase family protein YurZ|nr:carboxymuconolactone decarboxylase family protein [Eubacteriales bacterium]MDH7566632.1 carboxymuconolactone decarboxylase family protein [Clostridiales bacterium]